MSNDLLINLFKIVKKKGLIDDEIRNLLEEFFPNKTSRVIEVVKRGFTKNIYKPSNKTVWVVRGEDCEHLIYPKIFCSCQDFYKNVIVKRKRRYCKHLIAQIISEALNDYKELILEDFEFKDIVNELGLKF